jgi:hypothetical protein
MQGEDRKRIEKENREILGQLEVNDKVVEAEYNNQLTIVDML